MNKIALVPPASKLDPLRCYQHATTQVDALLHQRNLDLPSLRAELVEVVALAIARRGLAAVAGHIEEIAVKVAAERLGVQPPQPVTPTPEPPEAA